MRALKIKKTNYLKNKLLKLATEMKHASVDTIMYIYIYYLLYTRTHTHVCVFMYMHMYL